MYKYVRKGATQMLPVLAWHFQSTSGLLWVPVELD